MDFEKQRQRVGRLLAFARMVRPNELYEHAIFSKLDSPDDGIEYQPKAVSFRLPDRTVKVRTRRVKPTDRNLPTARILTGEEAIVQAVNLFASRAALIRAGFPNGVASITEAMSALMYDAEIVKSAVEMYECPTDGWIGE